MTRLQIKSFHFKKESLKSVQWQTVEREKIAYDLNVKFL